MLARLLISLSLLAATAPAAAGCATVPGQNAPLPHPPSAEVPEGERWSYYQAHGADGLVDRTWPDRQGQNLRLKSGAEVRHVENLAPVIDGAEVAAEALARYEKARLQAERTHLAYTLVSASVLVPMLLILVPVDVALIVDQLDSSSAKGPTVAGDFAFVGMSVFAVTALPWFALNLPIVLFLSAHTIDAQLKQDQAQEALFAVYDDALRERLGLLAPAGAPDEWE